MKLLTFITALTLIFSSQSFAKSPAGKVLYCPNDKYPDNSKGWVFLDEKNVELLFFFSQKIVSTKLPYTTTIDKVNIYKDDMSTLWFVIDRKSLQLELSKLQCSIKNSKQEVVDNMNSKLKEFMDSNQI